MKDQNHGDPRKSVDDSHGGHAAHGCKACAGDRAVAGHPVLAAAAERIRIDRESEASHDLIL